MLSDEDKLKFEVSVGKSFLYAKPILENAETDVIMEALVRAAMNQALPVFIFAMGMRWAELSTGQVRR